MGCVGSNDRRRRDSEATRKNIKDKNDKAKTKIKAIVWYEYYTITLMYSLASVLQGAVVDEPPESTRKTCVCATLIYLKRKKEIFGMMRE